MKQSIKEKISALESKLYESKLKDHARINGLGWGYAMRCVKMPSFTRTDNIQKRLDELKEKAKQQPL